MLHLQILLLEAYEQLEHDVAKEVQRALAAQATDLDKKIKRNKVLEDEIQNARKRHQDLDQHLEELQVKMNGIQERNRLYEEGVYGLPQVSMTANIPSCAILCTCVDL